MRGSAVAQGLRIVVLVSGLLVVRAAAGAGPPAVLPPGLARTVARREYEATPNAQGLQAPNRAHNLRTYFEPGGVRVHDRTAPGGPELLALTLTGVGRGDALAVVEPGELAHAGARVEIRRPGITEWYENSEAGLEQGFTLAEAPNGTAPLVLELAVTGARPTQFGDSVVFETGSGRRLRYAELVATDASQRPLTARFEVASGEHVRIVVDDAEAVYPLSVDPLLTQSWDTQLEPNVGLAHLGSTVASAGDVNGDGYADVIVGAPNAAGANGAAYIFLGGPSGIPSGGVSGAATVLTSTQFGSAFGISVAPAGDVNGDGYADVIVGSTNYDSGQGVGEGAAFVFLGGPSGIASGNESTAAARLESNQASANLGQSVASAGDVNGDGYADVIVGASGYDNGQTNEGAAFVFLGGPSGIANGNPATAAAVLESNQASASLGGSVASAGDVNGDGYSDVIVGASAYDNGQTDEGAAFIFLGSPSGIASGNPATAATLIESNQTSGGGGSAPGLGASVASAGDVNGDGYGDVIVGAPYYDNGQLDEGVALVFLGGPSGVASGNPSSAAALLESNQAGTLTAGHLGSSVSSAGDVNGDGYADVIVGARNYANGQTDEGAACVFLGGPSGVASGNPNTAAARLESNQASALLGSSVAAAGDVNGDGYADVIAGAPYYANGETEEGAAFVSLGGARGIVSGNPATAAAQLESNLASAHLGNYVASAGDVNGDGYEDVIVGAPQAAGGNGAAYIFLGGSSGISSGGPTGAATVLTSDQLSSSFGTSVASAGDVNGDGYADVIVGAFGYAAGQTGEGAAFVFLGGSSGVASGSTSTAAARLESNQAGAGMGVSVASAGDVNGDGYADVIVGASTYDNGQTDEGAAFVFLGGPSGIANGNPATAASVLESNQVNAAFGVAVASAGDVNGDGYADIVVGANHYAHGQTDEGAAFVFPGSASGIASANPASPGVATLESDQTGSYFGRTVASAGDVNGDGYADVIVGAPQYDNGATDEGVAFVFLGSAAGIASASPASPGVARLESNQASAFLGISVAGAGDLNGDGYADVIVGAFLFDNGQTDEGAAFVFPGSASGIASGDPATGAAAQLESDQASAQLGYSVAGTGDVNGDGYADVIVGAPNYDAGQTDEGAAFVFYGNGNRTGLPALASQRRSAVSANRVAAWGASYDAGFAVDLRRSDPSASSRTKLEVQRCPSGVPFGHASCASSVSSSWSTATTQALAISGLSDGALYRWRARLLYAPLKVTQPGITAPPRPAHGPWRRFDAQAREADLRVGLDTDLDGLRNSVDTDDDNDGLSDVAETALGTNPLNPDTDGDHVCDGSLQTGTCTAAGPDNCPFVANLAQTNGDAFAAGDACQCGDVTGEGAITVTDYTRAREYVVGRTLSGAFDPLRCDVTGDGVCGVADLEVLDRIRRGASATVQNHCAAYGGP